MALTWSFSTIAPKANQWSRTSASTAAPAGSVLNIGSVYQGSGVPSYLTQAVQDLNYTTKAVATAEQEMQEKWREKLFNVMMSVNSISPEENIKDTGNYYASSTGGQFGFWKSQQAANLLSLLLGGESKTPKQMAPTQNTFITNPGPQPKSFQENQRIAEETAQAKSDRLREEEARKGNFSYNKFVI